MTNARIGSVVVETLATPDGNARVGSVVVETLATPDGNARIGAIVVETLRTEGATPAQQAAWVKQTFTPVTSLASWAVDSGSPTPGNLLFAFLGSVDTQSALFSGDNLASPTQSGWTELHAGTARSAGGDSSGYLYWKIAGSSEPATYSFDFPITTSGAAHIVEVATFDPVTPINGTQYVTTSSGQTQALIPAFSTTVDGCLLLAFAFADEDSAGYEPYFADPMVPLWTPRYGSSSVPNTQGGATSYSGIASYDQLVAGSTGIVRCNIDAQNDAIVAYSVAVAPGAGAGGGGGGSGGGGGLGIGSLAITG